jgi:hypothetical protein
MIREQATRQALPEPLHLLLRRGNLDIGDNALLYFGQMAL